MREWTSYHSLGDLAAQHVKVRRDSGSSVAGRLYTESRSYFNGFGQEYRTTRSGTTEAEADFVVALRAFDGRGNLSWESLPLTWAQSATQLYVGPESRTSFERDTLGRIIRVTQADGAYRTHEYTAETFGSFGGQSLAWPTTVVRDEHCFDAAAANTLCTPVSNSTDARGNLIRSRMVDAALTDVGPSTSQERVTSYHFKPLGQMVYVGDPGGSVWSYTYDSFGNRTAATDPALGPWTTTFDANANVTLQIDARNQRVELAYDALNRISQKRVVAGSVTETTTFTYDQARTGYFNKGALTTTAVSTATAGTYHVIERDVGNDGQVQRVANVIDGRWYEQYINYRKNGAVNNLRLPNQPGGSGIAWLPESFEYDAAGRMTKMSTYIPAVTYNIWDQPLRMDYGSGAHESYAYDAQRGWVHTMKLRSPTNSLLDYTNYDRSATGRVMRQTTPYDQGKLDYTYDYAGRLKTAQNWGADASHSQVFNYTRAGSIAANSLVGTYAYPAAKHAPSSVTIGGVTTALTYDANGNMTRGLNGKVIAVDGENRVSSVTHAGKVTRYVYGADGSRLKTIENAGTAQQSVTVYFGMIEIRKWGQGAAEVVIATPHPSVRLVNGQPSYLYRDQLGSVRMVTDATGARDQRKLYRAFGGETQWQHDATAITENRGFVGQHVDRDSDLQFLNARYFDQQLGLFVSADWLDVNQRGVGTNRYSYAGNDPVNRADPSGNAWIDRAFESVFGEGSFDRTFGAGASESMDRIADSLFGNSSDRQASSNYTSYSNSGGALGYDAWRVGTGNFTGSLRNDLAAQGVGGNIVGGSVHADGSFSVFTRNSPTTEHIFSPGGRLVDSIEIGLGFGGRLLGGTIGLILTPTAAGTGSTLPEYVTFYHYTTVALANQIFSSGVLHRPAYATIERMSQSQVENVIFIGNPAFIGRGAGVVTMNLS